MKAKLILYQREKHPNGDLIEMVAWQVPIRVKGSSHPFKYRFAYVKDRRCVVRFDNERGKGDHLHVGEVETPYAFTTPQALVDDFKKEIEKWT